MAEPTQSRGLVRFGVFELDTRSGELRKQGQRIRLQNQPLRLLELLLEHPGELVTREELRAQLWPADTFVDFEDGLNTAINKLRQALGDSAESPRFVETIPRRGYRFIAAVETVSARPEPVVPATPGEEPLREKLPPVAEPVAPAGRKPRSLWLWRLASAAVVVVVLLAGWRWRLHRQPGTYVIAVLPFKNLSPDPGSDYFSDGLTDEIIRNLSILEGVQVKSQTSSFEFKGKPRNIREVGAKLGANLVLEGSVLRSGDKLRIDAQLIRVADDAPLWSARYDRELKDVFAIQDEISHSIVNELRLKSVGGQRRYNTNLGAYELYLQAKTLESLRSNQYTAQLHQSIALYRQVIAKDPNFAPAYAGMAMAYANLSTSPPHFDAVFAAAQMRLAAEKALQLDPLLPEAYEAMGLVHARELAWADAEQDFRRTLQMNPNLSAAHIDLVFAVLHPMGRFDEGVLELKKALELDPLSLAARRQMAFLLLSAHRYDEALDYSRQLAELDPKDFFAQQFSGRALAGQGKFNEAIPIFEKLGENSQHFLGYAYVQAGRLDDARQLITRTNGWPARQAIIYAALGDKDHAFRSLAEMAAMKDPRVDCYPFFLELSSLRSDPRMKIFRQQRGLSWSP